MFVLCCNGAIAKPLIPKGSNKPMFYVGCFWPPQHHPSILFPPISSHSAFSGSEAPGLATVPCILIT